MDFAQLLDATVTGLGYELVAWERTGKGALLRLFVDKPGGVEIAGRFARHQQETALYPAAHCSARRLMAERTSSATRNASRPSLALAAPSPRPGSECTKAASSS